MSEKNFDKYVYFVCKAKVFAIVIRPDRKRVVDGEVKFEEGLRKEFKNKMLRVEKTDENKGIIEKLREKIKEQESLDPKRRSFWEEKKPESMLPESAVKEKLDEKNEEIASLKERLKISEGDGEKKDGEDVRGPRNDK